MAAARVLQVGARADDHTILRDVLQAAGLADVVSAVPTAALQLIGSRSFDLVIVDVMQSSEDVLTLLRAAANVKGGRVPVVVTGPLEAADRLQACLQRGVEDYLTTPLEAQNPLLITRRIELCLHRRKLADFSVRLLSNGKDPNDTQVLKVKDPEPVPATHSISLSEAASRFVPWDFLKNLGGSTPGDIALGEFVERDMTVFFSDIRDFTTLSEEMTPEENFKFLTSYLRNVTPVIHGRGGFIDKYMGDGVIALYPGSPQDALQAAVDMQTKLVQYNLGRRRAGYRPLKVGMGLHRGKMILGAIGDEERMQTTIIADAVNTCSRIEGMTKTFGVPLLVSGDVIAAFPSDHSFRLRHLGAVKAKGKTQSVEIYECYNTDSDELIAHKDWTIEPFAAGMAEFKKGMFLTAGRIFAKIAERNADDTVAAYYRDRCSLTVVRDRAPGRFDGAEKMETK